MFYRSKNLGSLSGLATIGGMCSERSAAVVTVSTFNDYSNLSSWQTIKQGDLEKPFPIPVNLKKIKKIK